MAQKAKRSAAQKRATAKMLAANRARRGTASKTTTRRAKRSTTRAASKPATSVVVVKQTAPATAKKSMRSRARSATSKARASAGRALKFGKGMVNDVLVPVAVGGAAASVVDVAYGAVKQYLPDSVADHPIGKPLIKTAAGVGIAMGLQKMKLLKPAQAKAAAIGVGIVQVHQLINGQIKQHTTVQLDGMGMTLGQLHAVLPSGTELNGLESLGAMLSGDQRLGAVLPYMTDEAA